MSPALHVPPAQVSKREDLLADDPSVRGLLETKACRVYFVRARWVFDAGVGILSLAGRRQKISRGAETSSLSCSVWCLTGSRSEPRNLFAAAARRSSFALLEGVPKTERTPKTLAPVNIEADARVPACQRN